MKLETIDEPNQNLINFFDNKIAEFNWANWEVSERKHLAVQLKNDNGRIIAGSVARSFGDWLQLKTLWVSEELRGQNIGSKILNQIEAIGKERGCVKCFVDTLDFQAMPFYKKHGYKTVWVQEGYPKTGCRYYMVKEFVTE